MSTYLGFDTSNYRTSVALFGDIIKSERKLLTVKSGKLGLRQNDAVFLHTKQMPIVLKNLFLKNPVDLKNIRAIGASTKPRDSIDSYMPCFLVGKNVAQSLSTIIGVPFYEFSHQAGHIAAAAYSANSLELINKKFIAFHVSGGTTEALLVTPSDNVFSVEIIAKTLDLNAGQVIDRLGNMLSFPFPSGEYIEKLAVKGKQIKKVKPILKGNDCCLSGLENLCQNLLANNLAEDVALYLLEYISMTIILMCKNLLKEYGNLPLLFSGGVMANSIIKNNILNYFNALFASTELSGDNALGISLLTALKNGESLWI